MVFIFKLFIHSRGLHDLVKTYIVIISSYTAISIS